MEVKKINREVENNNDYTLYVSNGGSPLNTGEIDSPMTLQSAYNKVQELAVKNAVATIKLLDDIVLSSRVDMNGIYPVKITSNDSSQKINSISSSAQFEIVSETEGQVIIRTSAVPDTLIVNGSPRYMTENCSLSSPFDFVTLNSVNDYTIVDDNHVSIPLSSLTGNIPNIDNNTIIGWRQAWWIGLSYENRIDNGSLIMNMQYLHKSYITTRYPNSFVSLQFFNLPLVQKGKFYYVFDSQTSKYTIYYNKLNNETVTSVLVPNIETIISVDGASGITFSELKFIGTSYGKYTYDMQADGGRTNTCLKIQNSCYITVDWCIFSGIGNYAIGIEEENHYIDIQHSKITDTYGGGILVTGNIYDTIGGRANNCTIYDCMIYSIGRFNSSQEGILIKTGKDIIIDHCDVFDTYYTGISIGWTWGYSTNTFPVKVKVSNCHLHHCMQMVSNDGAIIYMLGNCKGTVIERNCIHDSYSKHTRGAGARGVYFDEGTSGVIVRYNTIFSCGDLVFSHYSTDNLVVNNVIAYDSFSALRDARIGANNSFIAVANVIIPENPLPYNPKLQPILTCLNVFEKNMPDNTSFSYDNVVASLPFENKCLGDFTYTGESLTLYPKRPYFPTDYIRIEADEQEQPCTIVMASFEFPHASDMAPGVISNALRSICTQYTLGSSWDIEKREEVKSYLGVTNEYLNYSI